MFKSRRSSSHHTSGSIIIIDMPKEPLTDTRGKGKPYVLLKRPDLNWLMPLSSTQAGMLMQKNNSYGEEYFCMWMTYQNFRYKFKTFQSL